MSLKITKGNKSDISVLVDLTQGLKGKIFGDKGYISKEVSDELCAKGLQLYTNLKKTAEKEKIHYQKQAYENKLKTYLDTNLLDIQKNTFCLKKLKQFIEDILPEVNRRGDGAAIIAEELLVPRKILQSENLLSENNLEFLAKLRLHNRSEKRKYKNYQDKGIEQKKYLNDTVTELTLNKTDIVKAQVKHKSKILRSEEIFYEGEKLTYEEIFNNNKIDKSILTSAQPKSSTFFYHLFGCETIKNPAAFIHNKMVWDLIKAGEKELTWEKALVKQKLPMAISGAIMGARIVNSDYNNFMPHEYLYDRE